MKARMKYIPPEAIQEATIIKNSFGLQKESDAFRKMAKYSIIGREIEKINFLNPPRYRKK